MSQREVKAIMGRLCLRAPQQESLKLLVSAIEAAPDMLKQGATTPR